MLSTSPLNTAGPDLNLIWTVSPNAELTILLLANLSHRKPKMGRPRPFEVVAHKEEDEEEDEVYFPNFQPTKMDN